MQYETVRELTQAEIDAVTGGQLVAISVPINIGVQTGLNLAAANFFSTVTQKISQRLGQQNFIV